MSGSFGHRRLRRAFRIRDVGRDVDEEIAFHLLETVEQLMAEGMDRERAEREARDRFGDEAGYRTELKAIAARAQTMRRNREWVEAAAGVLWQALRNARRSPTLSAGIVVALALGIGANVSMFSTIDRLLLRPPPHVENPEALRRIYADRFVAPLGERRPMRLTYDDLDALGSVRGFAGLAGSWSLDVPVGEGSNVRSVPGWAVSGDFWRLLGVEPYRGRFFAEADDVPNAEPVVVLGYGFWRRELGGDPAVVGRTLRIGATPYTIIGVAPEGFTGIELTAADLWVPLRQWFARVVVPSAGARASTWPFLNAVARLAPGVPPERALEQARAAYLSGSPPPDSTARLVLAPVSAARTPDATSVTRAADIATWLAGFAALVLLIACANVANLLLARSIRQRRETAIRLALGVSRSRLIGQGLMDVLVLAGMASVLALALAHWGGGLMQRAFLPRVAWTPVITPRLLLVLMVTTVATALLAGILAAGQAWRETAVVPQLRATLGGVSRSVSRVREWVTVSQAALSVILLIGAGLFIVSFARARAVDLGFDAQRVIALEPYVLQGYLGSDARLFERARERLAGVPGVEAVASGGPPFGQAGSPPLRATGHDSVPVQGGSGPYIRRVTPDYLRVMGIEVLAGRDFQAADAPVEAEPVAIVSRSMARFLWPGGPALGKCLFVLLEDRCTRIVGIASDANAAEIDETGTLTYYLVHEEQLAPFSTLLVRTRLPSSAMLHQLRRAALDADSRIRDVDVSTLRSGYVDPQLRSWKLGAILFGVLSVIAVIISMSGLYSILAFDVEQRKREIGVRTALGASRHSVLRSYLARAVKLTATGSAAGMIMALVLGPWIQDLLFRTSALEPAVLFAVTILLMLVAVTAAGVPAFRAAALDPSAILREE